MLPVSTSGTGSSKKVHGTRHRYSMLWLYFRRLFKPTQMDFQYTFWTMMQLCISPKTAYRHTSYHKQTKNLWARDDPAFVVLLSALVGLTSAIYSLVFSHSWARSLFGILSSVLMDFLLLGCIIATAGWVVSNKFLKKKAQHTHTVDQTVEWMYAFDIHCNAFFPLFLLLGVLQLALAPVLLTKGFLVGVISSALYAVAISYYFYITFLGYSALPFLERTEVFLYPIGAILLALSFAVLFGFNPTRFIIRLYYPA